MRRFVAMAMPVEG